MYDFALFFRLVLIQEIAHALHAPQIIMALTREQIENIAHLARLELKQPEVAVYQDSLSSIFEFVSELDRANTASVAPMAHPLPGLSQRLRPDAVTETDAHERYQANAPQTAAGLYLVPKVIE
jgi:aspartyl-tRNA(Asn)/glutamyl-tRNA(Gln) amidotransferase subunit C